MPLIRTPVWHHGTPRSLALAPCSPSSASDRRGWASLQSWIRSSGGRAGWPRRWISMKPLGLPIRCPCPSAAPDPREVPRVLLERGHLGLLGRHPEPAHPRLRVEHPPVV